MYHYSPLDKSILENRSNLFCDQIGRYLDGKIDDEQFKSLRLSNGLYMQIHAPMLRIAVPYGILNSGQFRALGEIAQDYDKSYAHISTRQNVQYNWIKLVDIPKVIQKLRSVDMHSIQTSGNVIRNITSDPLAAVSADEVVNPLIYCEVLRQWSTLHAEFQHLPRKFKVAIFGAKTDRVSALVHDIGIQVFKNKLGEVRLKIFVGGGLGRTPVIAEQICDNLEVKHYLQYMQAIVRVYNLYGRRDNLYKARIKILVRALGIDQFKKEVESEFIKVQKNYPQLTNQQIKQVENQFKFPSYLSQRNKTKNNLQINKWEMAFNERKNDPQFRLWLENNVLNHKFPEYKVVHLSLKTSKASPGDLTSKQFFAISDLADQYNFGEIRTTQDQNLVFAHIHIKDIYQLYLKLDKLKLATSNINHISNITCCPGLDYCSLADAYTHDVVKEIQEHFQAKDPQYQLKNIRIGISGCINSCAHHHVCDIGILGLVKSGEPHYQIRVGGQSGNTAHTKLAYMIGPAISRAQLIPTLEKIIAFYNQNKVKNESFHQTTVRLGDQKCQEILKQLIYPQQEAQNG